MSILTLADTIGDIKRFRYIITTLFEEGFDFFVDRAKLSWLVPLDCRIRCFLKIKITGKPSEEDLPARTRKVLIKLGPTFIKLGQIMSLRPDLLPPQLCDELAKLTDQVPSVPYLVVKQTVEKELKQPIAKLFKHFDENPRASASLAQVHQANLPNGTKVAVKVQRPGIKGIIEKDIHIMLYLAHVIEEKIPAFRIYRPVATVKEFAETIMRELDFTTEAIHAKRFARMFEGDPTVKVAGVFDEYSTKNILTMELIEGTKVDDTLSLKKMHIDKKILAQNGVNAFLRQVFVAGFFHADPHPGNYFALPGNIFAFVDYGMVGRLNAQDRRELASLFISFINQDSESAIGHIKHLVQTSEDSNISSFEHDVDDTLAQWYGAKLREVSLATAFYKIIESGRRNKIYFPSSLVFLSKALFTTEAMGYRLDPDFDFGREMAPFIKEILKSELSPQKLLQKSQDMFLDYVNYLEMLPEKTVSLLDKIESGEIGVKINPEELKELEIKISSENYKRLSTTIIASFLFAFGAAYLVENKLLNLHISVATFGSVFLLVIVLWVLRH